MYLDEWERSVLERDGFQMVQKRAMMLSQETLLGLKITGAFLSLLPQTNKICLIYLFSCF